MKLLMVLVAAAVAASLPSPFADPHYNLAYPPLPYPQGPRPFPAAKPITVEIPARNISLILPQGNGFPYYFPEAFPFIPPFVVKADESGKEDSDGEDKPASQKDLEAEEDPEAEEKGPEADP
nr:uncharacterized protein LOC113819828 [Penaeus vannamei]